LSAATAAGRELPFTHAEYADRLARVRTAMAARDLDVLVAADPSNIAWLTGYDGWSFYTHQAVVVTHDDAPTYWGRHMDAQGAKRTVYMDLDHIVGYHDDYVQSTDRHPHEHLSRWLASQGHDRARIGVEMDNYYYSAKAHAVLGDGLPDAELVDATGLVNWQRAVKSPTEIDYIRKAAQIVTRMHELAMERVEPGMRKSELVADIVHAGIDGIPGPDGFGGDYPAIVPIVPSGADASAAHLTWDDRPFERDTLSFFEIAGCYRRYHAPLCRSVYLGTPPPEVLAAEEALLEGVAAGIDAARAGNRACDIANALYSALDKAGIEREGRCGYPIGLSYPPDWGERTMSIRPSDESVLEAGMTFHFMPGLWMQDWGLELTESILIRPEGPAEVLADVPRRLVVKD